MAFISAYVLTKNSELLLDACLRSLTWVDELIVVDDNSTDSSREIALRYHAKIFTRELDTFSAQRNFALAQCTGDWIISLDSDEQISDELRDEVRDLLSRPCDYVAFRMPRKNFFLGKWIRGCGWYPDYGIRIYRREGAKYTRPVHEGLGITEGVKTLKCAVIHHPYHDLAQLTDKMNRYSTLSAQEKWEAGQRGSIVNILLDPPFAFFKHYLLQHGFTEGLTGFVISGVYCYYELMRWSKLYYLSRAHGHGTDPAKEQ